MLSAMPSRRQSSAIEVSPRRPSTTMRIFSSSAWCSGLSAGCGGQGSPTSPGWSWILSHLRSLKATMSQKSSVPQAVSFVAKVLKRDTGPQAFGRACTSGSVTGLSKTGGYSRQLGSRHLWCWFGRMDL